MGALRNILHGHLGIVALAMALVLAVKALVPAGYMFDGNATGPGVILCSGTNPLAKTQARVLTDMMKLVDAERGSTTAGDAKHSGGGNDDGQRAGADCPYSVLPMAALAAADPALLVAALAFILLLGFAAVAPPPVARSAYLRPPLRGPPAFV